MTDVIVRTWGEMPFFDKQFDLYQDGKNGYAVSSDGVKFYTATEVTADNGWVKVDVGNMQAIDTPISAGAFQQSVLGAIVYHATMLNLPEVAAWGAAHEGYMSDPTEETAARLVLTANLWRQLVIEHGSPVFGETPEQQADEVFQAKRDGLLFGDMLRSGSFNLELEDIGETE